MRWMAIVAVAGVLALAGCGGSDKSSNVSGASGGSSSSGNSGGGAYSKSTPSGSSSASGGKKVSIGADPGGALEFTKKTLKAKAGTVTFELDNPSQSPHAFEIEGNGISDKSTKIVTGAKATLTVNLKPGKYTFYCPVGQHRQAGMEGTLIVS